MTIEGLIVLGIILICLVLLISTAISVDIVLFGGLAFIFIAGIIPADQALSGFSNEGMLTVGALYIVAAGLKETGAIQFIVQKVMGNARTVKAAQLRIMSPVMIMSAFLNNTPIVASFIPALERWSRISKIPVSKIFIPLSYAAILGGTCTLIGTSTNLIINGLLIDEASTQSIGILEPALIGIPCAIVGFIYLLIFGDKLLPVRGSSMDTFKDPREYTIEMIVQDNAILSGQTIEDAGLRNLPGLFLIEIQRNGRAIPAPGPYEKLRGDDRLIFTGIVDSIIDLQQISGLKHATTQVFKLNAPRNERQMIEAVVSRSNPLMGRTIRDGNFRDRYDAVVLAVSRSGERINEKIGDITLKSGDVLLLETLPNFVQKYRNSSDFYLVSSIEDSSPVTYDKAWIAGLSLVAMVLLAATGVLSMLQAAIVAGGLLLVTKCFRYSTALESVDWRVLIAIASALGLGSALDYTGVAEHLAANLLSLAGDNPTLALLFTYLATWILTEMITNNAAAVLLFPIAVSLANSLGVDFMPFAMVMIIAASSSFSTPIGYQTNLMVYGPGGYRFTDFTRIGLPLNLIIATVAVSLIPHIWNF
ncbi:MAG: SLC13 family permease [Balneola sp.]|nr:SLC13 family permease [Balneola sp.]MBE80480.1 SLC13 family permease [Balneola sp.]HBX67031.1 SLC13 family permease [Balneolaceae bacterium]|tara:strand:- start:33511 stop:35280 length:1770 start_codon:yes stop_codon:yes gene_type:complete